MTAPEARSLGTLAAMKLEPRYLMLYFGPKGFGEQTSEPLIGGGMVLWVRDIEDLATYGAEATLGPIDAVCLGDPVAYGASIGVHF